MKVGDLVNINQERGAGCSYKYTLPRGLGVIMRLEETEPLMHDEIGPIIHVLLSTGKTEDFSPRSVEVISENG